jgi:hypothetical protein
VCAPNAGDHVGANPVDRGKPGSKIHLACEGSGLPLTAVVTAANISDVTMLAAVLDDVPAVLTQPGGGGPDPASWTLTRAMTARATVPGCGGVGSRRGSLGVGSSRRSGWGGIAGGWSGRCRG